MKSFLAQIGPYDPKLDNILGTLGDLTDSPFSSSSTIYLNPEVETEVLILSIFCYWTLHRENAPNFVRPLLIRLGDLYLQINSSHLQSWSFFETIKSTLMIKKIENGRLSVDDASEMKTILSFLYIRATNSGDYSFFFAATCLYTEAMITQLSNQITSLLDEDETKSSISTLLEQLDQLGENLNFAFALQSNNEVHEKSLREYQRLITAISLFRQCFIGLANL